MYQWPRTQAARVAGSAVRSLGDEVDDLDGLLFFFVTVPLCDLGCPWNSTQANPSGFTADWLNLSDDVMVQLINQVAVLLGVIIGALGSYLTTAATERAR